MFCRNPVKVNVNGRMVFYSLLTPDPRIPGIYAKFQSVRLYTLFTWC